MAITDPVSYVIDPLQWEESERVENVRDFL